MSKETNLILFGVLLCCSPFIGFSGAMQTIFVVVLSLGVILIGVSLKARARAEKKNEASSAQEHETISHDTKTPQGE